MKTERITILASPQFKAFVAKEAEAEGVSVSELIRRRCVRERDEDEQMLSLLIDELRESNLRANNALDDALDAIQTAITTMHQWRNEAQAVAV